MQAEADEAGRTLDLTPMQSLLADLIVHDDVVGHIASLRADGYRTALVTNNVREGSAAWRAMIPVDDLFDVVVDSSSVGMRKPNPAIFTHTLDLLGGVAPGPGGVPRRRRGQPGGARLAGLHTILVGDPPGPALVELDRLLGRAGAAGLTPGRATPGRTDRETAGRGLTRRGAPVATPVRSRRPAAAARGGGV